MRPPTSVLFVSFALFSAIAFISIFLCLISHATVAPMRTEKSHFCFNLRNYSAPRELFLDFASSNYLLLFQ